MPRFERFNHLYDAFQNVLDCCVRQDQSIFWPAQTLWTVGNLELLQKRFINAPNYEENLTFEEKLTAQLGNDQPLLWAIIADIYYIFYLPAKQLLYETKVNGIRRFEDKIPWPLPPDDHPIWEPLKNGMCRVGPRYNHKYRQFWLLVNLILALKRNGEAEHILADRASFQDLIDHEMNSFAAVDRAYDIRHAVLYLTFPDFYEPIISTGDKIRIANKFWDTQDGEQPEDVDAAIKVIRDRLQQLEANPQVPFHFYDTDLRAMWQGIQNQVGQVLETTPDDEGLLNYMKPFSFTKNIILYGPPGTGKTYIANQMAKQLVKDQLGETNLDLYRQQVIQDLTVYEQLALAFFLRGPESQLTVAEIKNLPEVRARFNYRPIRQENAAIWASLQVHSRPESQFVNVAHRAEPFLFDRLQEPKWFLTAEGKNYVEQNLGEQLETLNNPPESGSEEDYISWVTFHQSLSYEEFVEGLRPVRGEGNDSSISIDVVPGIFKTICSRAALAPDRNFVLVIDEINRGNISRVFGELITLVEDDKRAGELNELTVMLPYSKERFSVPSNLYLIGTMNTADRSIALIDAALRRRFAFIEIMPNTGLLKEKVVSLNDLRIDLSQLLEALNARIIRVLDKDHQVGHSYLLKVSQLNGPDQITALEYAWNYQVLPLLEEYFYSQPEQLVDLFRPFVDKELQGEQFGGTSLMRLEGEDLLSELNKLILTLPPE